MVDIRPLVFKDIEILVRDYCFPWSTEEEISARWQKYFTEQQQGVRIAAVLVQGHDILGYGCLLLHSECPFFVNIPEICDLWIHEDHQRRGLGTRLIRWFEELAKSKGFSQIGIGVGLYADYGPAQKLYFKLGYKPDGNGITYKYKPTKAGESYCLDDDLIFWLKKTL